MLKKNSQKLLSWIAFLVPMGYFLVFNFMIKRPYYIQRGDPEQDLFYIAKVIDTGSFPLWYDHPGTPLHYFLWGIYRLVQGDPSRFLFWGRLTSTLFLSISLILLIRFALKNIPWEIGLLSLALVLSQPTIITFIEQLNADSFMVPAAIAFLALAWSLVTPSDFSRKRLIWTGILGGLMLSIKFSTLPLAVSVSVMLSWQWLRTKHTRKFWLIYHLVLSMSFVLLGTFPRPQELFPMLSFLLQRSDMSVHTSFALIKHAWLRIVNPRDHYWFPVFLTWFGIAGFLILTIALSLKKHLLFQKTYQVSRLLFILAGFAGWVYTIMAQHLPGNRFTTEYLLSLGYIIRNTCPPTLVFPFAVVWIFQQWEALALSLSSRLQNIYRSRFVFLSIMSWTLIFWGIAIGGFTIETAQAIRSLEKLSQITQQTFLSQRTPDTRVAFFEGKGFTAFGEASFHFEGNFARGRKLFTRQLLQQYPQYTLFEIRTLGWTYSQLGLPDIPSEQTIPPQNCSQIKQSLSPQDMPREYIWGFNQGVRPSVIAFIEIEMTSVAHLSLEEVLQALCVYGTPTQASKMTIGPATWIVIQMTYPASNTDD